MFLLTAVLALGLLLGGCPKKEEAKPDEPAAKEEPKEEPKKEEPKEEPKKEEPAAAAAGDAERDCGALHEMMKQMIEGMMAKMGKGAKPKKEFPSKEKFVAACKELPSNVVRCMNPQVAMKEAAKCQEAMKNADPEKVAKFKSMLK
jgi:hypothetical protein